MTNRGKSSNLASVVSYDTNNSTLNADLNKCYFYPINRQKSNKLKEESHSYSPSSTSKIKSIFNKAKDIYHNPEKYVSKVKQKLESKVYEKVGNAKKKTNKLKDILSSYISPKKVHNIRKKKTERYTWKKAFQREVASFKKHFSSFSSNVKERYDHSIISNNKVKRTKPDFSKKKIIKFGLEDKLNNIVKRGTKFSNVEKYVNSLGMNISKSTYYRIRNRKNYFA